MIRNNDILRIFIIFVHTVAASQLIFSVHVLSTASGVVD